MFLRGSRREPGVIREIEGAVETSKRVVALLLWTRRQILSPY
ncbi:MAG: hypothetical protein ABI085_14140 [Gemmatimonadaceae bacterium]